ncbi:hypothetical protein ERH_0225 [Erysipelothrix rhusiopathiae str. Fujisawa]|nr:hypothetical protein ERH_0225 [Erysipelothrix rhusiopathiae str. Fujisawa]
MLLFYILSVPLSFKRYKRQNILLNQQIIVIFIQKTYKKDILFALILSIPQPRRKQVSQCVSMSFKVLNRRHRYKTLCTRLSRIIGS